MLSNLTPFPADIRAITSCAVWFHKKRTLANPLILHQSSTNPNFVGATLVCESTRRDLLILTTPLSPVPSLIQVKRENKNLPPLKKVVTINSTSHNFLLKGRGPNPPQRLNCDRVNKSRLVNGPSNWVKVVRKPPTPL